MTTRLGQPDDDALVVELGAAFSAEMLRQTASCPLVPGAEAFLATAQRALPVFLASVTPQKELETILERGGLAHYFTRVYGCPPWSKRRAVADIIAQLGGPRGVLFIGDSAGDQRAALEAGLEFIARDSGLPFEAPAPRSFPDMIQVLAATAGRLPTR